MFDPPTPEAGWLRLTETEVHDLGMHSDFVGNAYRVPDTGAIMVACMNFWIKRIPLTPALK